jgi:hypothetical protein
VLRPNRSVDLGLGVKSQSRPVIAGSSRNVPQYSLAGGSQQGKETDWMVKVRKHQPSCQTLNLLAPEKAGVRVLG